MSITSAGKSCMVQGRIVWVSGDLFKGKVKTDMNTRQPLIDQRTGSPKMEYGFGLAVPKSLLQQVGAGQPGEIWSAIHEEAYTLYPSRQLPPAFAMKYKDGDGIDDKGQPFANREGYAGHLVFAMTTSLPIKFFRFENNQNILINDGIKCGDYVNVQVHIKAHPAQGQGKAGLYLNPNAVQFLGYGKEIVNAPSGDQIFGVQAPSIPQGASATPIAPPGMLVPAASPVPGPMAPVAQQPWSTGPVAPVQMPAGPPMPVQPNYSVVPQALQPSAQPIGMPPLPGAPR